MDVRIQTSSYRPSARSVFDPYQKTCRGEGEVCCKGTCKEDSRRKLVKVTRPKAKTSTFCPGDFTGLRSVAGVCDKFVECYKGRAVVKDCPPGTTFCMNSLMCDWPGKAKCHQMAGEVTLNVTKSISVTSSSYSVSETPGGPQQDEQYSPPSWAEVILARRAGTGDEVVAAPPSGQTVRLRRGKSPSDGYLQVFLHNRWGYVCDGGEWTMAEADLVCRQLGFSRGVSRTTQGLVHGKVRQEERATESVECGGQEEGLEECRMTAAGEGRKECEVEEDIVSISCIPDSWAACDEGEIPFKDSCYSFHSKPTTFHKAVALCEKKGSVLVEIESQVENDLLSELLFQSSVYSNKMDHVWTGGVGSNIARKAGRPGFKHLKALTTFCWSKVFASAKSAVNRTSGSGTATRIRS